MFNRCHTVIAATVALAFLGPMAAAGQNLADRNAKEVADYVLTDAAARMDRNPGATAALKAAGMTAREYLLFSWSVFQNGMAAWALDQPGGSLPPGTKPTNVNFYRAHKAELEKLGELTREMDCDNR